MAILEIKRTTVFVFLMILFDFDFDRFKPELCDVQDGCIMSDVAVFASWGDPAF